MDLNDDFASDQFDLEADRQSEVRKLLIEMNIDPKYADLGSGEEWERLGKVEKPADVQDFFWCCAGYTLADLKKMLADGTYVKESE